jgi:hypothetical protein
MVARARPIEIALDVKAVDGFGPVVEAGTGRIVVGPEIHADGFAEDEPVFDQVTLKSVPALAEAAATTPATPTLCSRSCAAGRSPRTVVAR